MNVGAKILKLMKHRQITQEALAVVLGISQKSVHDIVTGKTKKIDFVLMHKICKALRIDIDYFLNEDENIHLYENNGIALGNHHTNNINLNEELIKHILNRLDILESKTNS